MKIKAPQEIWDRKRDAVEEIDAGFARRAAPARREDRAGAAERYRDGERQKRQFEGRGQPAEHDFGDALAQRDRRAEISLQDMAEPDRD